MENIVLKTKKRVSKARWGHAKVVTEIKYLKSVLKEAKRKVSLEKAWVYKAYVESTRRDKDARMVIRETKHNAIEEIT